MATLAQNVNELLLSRTLAAFVISQESFMWVFVFWSHNLGDMSNLFPIQYHVVETSWTHFRSCSAVYMAQDQTVEAAEVKFVFTG